MQATRSKAQASFLGIHKAGRLATERDTGSGTVKESHIRLKAHWERIQSNVTALGFGTKKGRGVKASACIGAGDDTHTDHWKIDKGQEVGQWKYLSGTGKYTGIKGEGTYTHTELPAGRSMSEWEGEISLAK